MKINIKKIMGLVLGTTILASSIGFAAPETIQAFNQPDFTIKVNGVTQIHPEGLKPIVYQNRTYLPASYIAQLLGAETTFDSSTKTINIKSKDDNSLNQEKIENYEIKIKELEEKIKKLEASISDTSNYSKLPARLSQNGYKLTIEGLSVRDSGRDGRLYFTLKNEDADNSVKINALETTIEANGIKYKASAKYQEYFDTKLTNWIRRDNELESYIPFSDLPEDKDIQEMLVTVVLEKNETFPKKETIVFKVLND